MALIFVDGFDTYQNPTDMARFGWDNSNSSFGVGRVAGRAFTTGAGGQETVNKTITSTSTCYVGFAFSVVASISINMFSMRDSNSDHLTIQLVNDRLNVLRAATTLTTLGAPASNIINTGYRHMVVSANINNATGSYKVLFDGVTVAAETNIDTASSTVPAVSKIRIGNVLMDDLYVGDATGSAPYNANLGDCRIETLRPTADVSANWIPVPTTTGNWRHVADVSTSVSSWIQTSLTGVRDLYTVGDMSFVPVTVYAVVPTYLTQKMDAGSLPVRPVLISGAQTTVGSVVAPLLSVMTWQQSIFTQNPDGATGWTYGTVNALQLGIETT